MPTTEENKPNARPARRSRKAKQPGPKADQRPRPKAERRQDDSDRIEAAVALNEMLPVEAVASPDPAGIEPAAAAIEPHADCALVPVGPSPIALAGPIETFWTGFQSIAHAYTACAWRSMEESMGLVEKLTLARSLGKTVEIQNEFSRQACDGFLEDSQKIWRLYSEFGRQIFRSFERFLVWRTPVAH